MNNLGRYLGNRYKLTKNLEDLEVAIIHAERAVETTPEDHPDRARWLNNLAIYFSRRCERTGNSLDLGLAIDACFSSWRIPTAPILTRIEAASRAAQTLVSNYNALPAFNDLSRACSLLRDATLLIPLATSRSLQREDQQHILGQFTGLASHAAAVSLQAGKSPLEALRLQELGRSVTNGQLLDYRSDISDLMEQYPALASDFDSLRQELDSPFLPMISLSRSDTSMQTVSKDNRVQIQQVAIARRNEVSKGVDNILRQIRQKPGFQTFLLAESEEYFLTAAQQGPIVVLNGTELRSDAILVTKEQVTSIPLPKLSHASMHKYLGTSTNENGLKREMLEWLWKAAVEPVLRELGFYPKAVDPLPRIWWIGIGLLAQAPIHAAAVFIKRTKIKMTTLQYCLPSYTSTIRALQYSRSRQQYHQNTSTLVMTMPTTSGEDSLGGVTKEADAIQHSLRGFSTVEILESPTAGDVLQALSRYGIAHFACHGVSSENPAESHLLLLNDTRREVDMLRVKDIAALKLPAARLAYLSACRTAESTSSHLADEVTHIVSSFHVAGFSNVIGTLWSAQDEACPKMAADFYSTLSKTDDVAASYRTAVLELMKQKPSQPLYWAPFIHFGA